MHCAPQAQNVLSQGSVEISTISLVGISVVESIKMVFIIKACTFSLLVLSAYLLSCRHMIHEVVIGDDLNMSVHC